MSKTQTRRRWLRFTRSLAAFVASALWLIAPAPDADAVLVARQAAAKGAERASAGVPFSPERGPISEVPPSPARGLAFVFEQLGLDDYLRAFPALLSAPRPGELGGPEQAAGWRSQLAFYDGRVAFQRIYGVEDGLGPHYNDTSCANCHLQPTLGGGGRDMDHGVTGHGPAWTDGDAVGVRKHAIAGFELEVIEGPTAKMRTPPLYGLGRLDSIDEAARAAIEDPDDGDHDGVRGRRAWRGSGSARRPARFGHKANEWTLAHFCAGALNDEIGITNVVRRQPRADADAVADPEASSDDVQRIIAYVRGLAPPQPAPSTKESERGRAHFAAIGCATCHQPSLGGVDGAYSDTLLHDLGPGLAGLPDGSATAQDWRTPPLWGLRLRQRYLHDERAATLVEAIAAHAGEASAARSAFVALPAAERSALLGFLATL